MSERYVVITYRLINSIKTEEEFSSFKSNYEEEISH